MASYALTQGKANFVVSTPLTPSHPAAEHIERHGDGVRDIALEVGDADLAFEQALARGAEAAEAPHDLKDEFGTVRRAAIRTYGDTIHSLLSRRGYSGPFLPGYAEQRIAGDDAGILRIDHMVGNVELGQMNRWAEYYSKVFGFHRFISFDDKDISTEYSALMSIVMSDDSYSVKFPINEPAPGKRKSQIEEYLEAYQGAGVQHIALQVTDVLSTVDKLQRNGVQFLRVPDSYYDILWSASENLKSRWRRSSAWEFWWTRTRRDICCRSSPVRWRIGPRFFTRSSSAREAGALARETSRRCLRQSNWSRRGAAICSAAVTTLQRSGSAQRQGMRWQTK